MPVISPRRSSTSASGIIYSTTTSAPGVSLVTSSPSATRSSGYKSYLDRAGSLSKLTSSSPSSYSPVASGSYLTSNSYTSYAPRTSAYRSSGLSLTGGAAAVGTYRSTASTLGAFDYDAAPFSRYGRISCRSSSITSL